MSERDNPPGQSALRYRIADHPRFYRRMIEALSRPAEGEGLRALTTRSPGDGTLALVDAWAAVLDVLTFYEERALSERFLRTAVERRSVLEIARAIGYAPSTGVASAADLAFEVDPNVEGEVAVPVGLPVMSVPPPEEASAEGPPARPQTFETIERVGARAAWNAMRPVRTEAQAITTGTDVLYVGGVEARLDVGDALVLLGRGRRHDDESERWDLRFVVEVERVREVEPPDRPYTRVTLDRGLGGGGTAPAAHDVRLFVFRERASLFGYNAPDFRMVSESAPASYASASGTEWADFTQLKHDATTQPSLATGEGVIDLDREHPSIVPGSWVCLEERAETELYRVRAVQPSSRVGFTLSAKVTRLRLDGVQHLGRFRRRETVVHAVSEELSLVRAPRTDLVPRRVITLDRAIPELPPGRALIFEGLDASGAPVAERAILSAQRADGERSVLELAEALTHDYRRDSLTIRGNVARATHGVSVQAVLGSGDATQPHQAFAVRETPITEVPSDEPGGASSTLVVQVDGVTWERVPSLHDRGPNDRVYMLRYEGDGAPVVQLGDGVRGARATTGEENVRASHRVGLGREGEVPAGALSILQRRPLGLRGAVNPMPSTTASDPAGRDEVRAHAAAFAAAVDRLVSLSDYEVYAARFEGVGKALGVSLWDGRRSFVHLTVGGAASRPLAADEPLMGRLVRSLESFKDPAHVVEVSSFLDARFGLRVRVLREPTAPADGVEEAIRLTLLERFGYAARPFARGVSASEVIAAIQRVPSVVAVDLDWLRRTRRRGAAGIWHAHTSASAAHLDADRPRYSGGALREAEVLLIDPDAIRIDWMAS